MNSCLTCKISIYQLIIFILVVLLFPLKYSFSGDFSEGSLPTTPHKLNISVAFQYDETDIDSWKPVFEEASKLLFNATEKQVQLGRVEVFNNCAPQKKVADILISSTDRGAKVNTVDNRPLGMKKDEEHIWLYARHKNTSGTYIGQFGMVHEIGHYVFDLWDEYRGVSMNKDEAPSDTPTKSPTETFYCAEADGAGKASIMDGGSGDSPANARTEFCTDPADGFTTSHESGYINGDNYYITDQQDKHGESSWQRIVKTLPNEFSITVQEPSSEPSNSTSGHQAIEWIMQECEVRTVITIDRSGSMAGDKINLAKTGADLFVDLSVVGEDLGVTSFASTASINFPLQEVIDESTKTAARTEIQKIIASGATSIGDGLRVSLNEILTKTERTENEFIVLLSDGYHNTGENPNDVIPDLKSEKVKVHTVGVGSADVNLLQKIANETGGKFFFANDASSLPSIFTDISAEARGNNQISEIGDLIGESEQKSFDVFIDSFNEEVTFVLSWQGSDLDLKLETPDGTIIDPTFAASNPDKVEFVSNYNYEFYRVRDPQTGIWQIIIDAIDVQIEERFIVQVLDKTLNVHFTTSTDKDDYVFPEKVLIRAFVAADTAVAGASVSGTIQRPDSSSVDINLFDDGLTIHGDIKPNDGVYSNFFYNYSIDGVYSFNLVVNNTSGTDTPPDNPENDPGYVPTPISPFTREVETSIQISGIPDIISADVNIDPETLNIRAKGKFITAYIELNAPYDVSDIDTATCLLYDGATTVSSALSRPIAIGDRDQDGRLDLMIKFDRKIVGDYLFVAGKTSQPVEFTVEGFLISGELLVGDSVVQVINPGVQ